VSAERLAIEGGTPVRTPLLPYGGQVIDETDIQAVVHALRDDWLTTGPRVSRFERAVADRVGARHAVAVNSGTAALHAAAFAAGIGPGDEVIVPALTFAATANAVLYLGGRPVFADVRDDTLNLDPERAAALIGPRTRALATVDFAGQPSDLDPLRALADRHGLVLIDDAAHALGAVYHGRPVGTQAHLTTFSFHPVKAITTGEGGMVITDDEDRAARARRFRNHGISTEAAARHEAGQWHYDMVDLGFNYRLPDIQCALGLAQLARLDTFLKRRTEIAARYRGALATVPGLRLPTVAPDLTHAWHIFPVRLDPARLRVGRAEVFAALRAEGIGVTVHYIPVYHHPYYQRLGYPRALCPVAEAAHERLLTLPISARMSERDAGDVVTAVHKVLGHFAA
jgi:UDP-4-amino-4,6-dideoxy-N-acetyl-beta-L-altrosamine transaminase